MGLMVGDRFKEVEEIGNDFGGGCKLGRSEVVILRISGFFFSKIFLGSQLSYEKLTS